MADSKSLSSGVSKLDYVFKNVWEGADDALKERIHDFSDDYKLFLDASKTERECAAEIRKRATDMGFVDLNAFLEDGGKPETGDKFYIVDKNKSLILIVMGEEPLSKGFKGVGAHIDSPRLDLKQNPLYEEEDMAYFKTHYYGGIKKYQWLATPLALHGVVVKKGGEVVNISIGDSDEDPVFFIADLLPHLAKEQMAKKLSEAVAGEALNVMVGSEYSKDDESKSRVKDRVFELLEQAYGISALDLMTAELEIVPAGKARDMGFDRSLIVAYGHDDRSCAYATMQAVFEVERPKYSSIALFVDKEEIGSAGSTAAGALFLERVLGELVYAACKDSCPSVDIELRRSFSNSKFLSADVTAAFDPNYPNVLDKRNSSRINYGVCISKYTGHGGKYSTNDAHAEFLREVVDVFEDNSVVWQSGEMGKVDQGGGGTIASELAVYGGEVIDCGIPTLSMHGTYELVAKADVYMAYKAYHGFFNS